MTRSSSGELAGSEALRAEDARARRLAQSEFERPIVLEAGAGTGKTAVLVSRVVSWCTGPGWERVEAEDAGDSSLEAQPAPRVLRGVVAITFTEAAAAEMADRIREALSQLAHGELPTGMDPVEVPERTAVRARALLDHLELLSVGTIHAFCHRLLSEAPLQAGLHPAFEVDPDGSRRREVLREVIEEGLARGFAGESQTEWRRLAAEGFGPAELEEALGLLLDHGRSEELLGVEGSAFLDVDAFIAEYVSDCRELLATGAAISRGLARETLDALQSSLDALADGEALTSVQLHLEEKHDNRVRDWARDRFGKSEEEEVGDSRVRFVEGARKVSPKLRGLRRYRPELFAALRGVLGDLSKRARVQLRRRGVLSFDGLLRSAAELLEDHPAQCRRWRERIEQILVDEFQDTDPIQCELLRRLALGGERGPGLFVVGDPKQSIYGFREADLRAYTDFVAEVLSASGLRLPLSVNFRSDPPILDEVERLLAPLMLEVPGRQPPFAPLLPGRAPDDDSAASGPSVSYWVGWEFDEGRGRTPGRAEAGARLEARALVRDLRESASAGVPWSEMALLFRSVRDIDVTLSALRDADIPYRLDHDAVGEARRELLDAIALLRCVFDPSDHLALATWLRSAWVGLPDAALAKLRIRGFFELTESLAEEESDPISSLRERFEADGLAAAWSQSLAFSLAALADARRSLSSLAPDRWLDRLRRVFAIDGSEALRRQSRHRLENLEALWQHFSRSFQTPATLLGSLEELERRLAHGEEERFERFRATAEDAVTVSTIHGAKGLDWEQVYLLRLERRPPHAPPPTRLARDGEKAGARLLGVSNLWDESAGSERRIDEEAEQLRLLYVAMTRAKRRLVISGVWPLPGRRAPTSPIGRICEHVLSDRDPSLEDMASAAQDGTFRDGLGRAFVFPALLPADPAKSSEAQEASPAPGRVETLRRAEVERLALREQAEARQECPLQGIASERAEVHSPSPGGDTKGISPAPTSARRSFDGGLGPEVARTRALALGEALHAALEHFDAEEDSEVAAQAMGRVGGAVLAAKLDRPDREAVAGELGELIAAFLAGPLHRKLADTAPRIVAKELPILVEAPSTPGEALSHIAGSIDLLYRADDGEFVVADFKTDRVTGGEELQRADAYRRQGEIYTRAVQRGLGLERRPRFELWWLRSQQVTAIELAASPTGPVSAPAPTCTAAVSEPDGSGPSEQLDLFSPGPS